MCVCVLPLNCDVCSDINETLLLDVLFGESAKLRHILPVPIFKVNLILKVLLKAVLTALKMRVEKKFD